MVRGADGAHDAGLTACLAAAMERLREAEEGRLHPAPSASALDSCLLQQWFAASGIPRSDRVPAQSIKRMASGAAIEEFWRAALLEAGFIVAHPLPRLEWEGISGQGDGLLYPFAAGLRESLGPGPLLLELKDLGVWTYSAVVDRGVRYGAPAYWTQMQAYFRIYGLERGIFLAGIADPSALTYVWRRLKKRDSNYPPFYVEVVDREPGIENDLISRGAPLRQTLENGGLPPRWFREYSPEELVPTKAFPCGYCGWATLCLRGAPWEGGGG